MVKSLVELCTAAGIRHIKSITDVGAMNYELARPILAKVDSAVQLRRIELASPHLEDDTGEHWKRLIARNFPVLSTRHNFEPSNPRSWHKIYAKYRRIDTEQKREAEERLTNAFKSIKQERVENSSQVVTYDSRKLPRLPRDVKPQVGVRPKGYRGGPDQSELRFTGGSRTKTNTPKSLLKRALREAKEISARKRLDTEAGPGRVRREQLMRAPQGMVQEKVNEARPLTSIRPPTHRPKLATHGSDLDDKEARLRKAKAPALRQGGKYIADEDLDDFEVDDDESGPVGLDIDDLEASFDEPEPAPKATLAVPSSTAAPRRRSAFARKMGASNPVVSRVSVESRPTQPANKATQSRDEPDKKAASPSDGPASPPKPAASSQATPALRPMMPRKRKAVDIFMKQKPKVPRT
ncbi:hypothetical protein GGS20DRAFT_561022 [Poronia punctata]|nr:hypothetical protein GGS20DRAFT_561022 [Poronia punctata]